MRLEMPRNCHLKRVSSRPRAPQETPAPCWHCCSPRRLLYDYWGDDEQSPEPEPGGVPASACSRSAALALYVRTRLACPTPDAAASP